MKRLISIIGILLVVLVWAGLIYQIVVRPSPWHTMNVIIKGDGLGKYGLSCGRVMVIEEERLGSACWVKEDGTTHWMWFEPTNGVIQSQIQLSQPGDYTIGSDISDLYDLRVLARNENGETVTSLWTSIGCCDMWGAQFEGFALFIFDNNSVEIINLPGQISALQFFGHTEGIVWQQSKLELVVSPTDEEQEANPDLLATIYPYDRAKGWQTSPYSQTTS